MARDTCIDCKQDFPGGEGLYDGRCPSCDAIYDEKERQRVQPAPAGPPAEGPRGFFGRRREEQPGPGEHPEGERGES